MSLFDNMLMGNKNQKQKKDERSRSREAKKDTLFEQEFSKELSRSLNHGKESEPKPESYDFFPGMNKKRNADENNFEEEFSEGLMSDVSRFGIQSYSKAGVTFEKLSENKAKIYYNGLLAKSGAQEILGVYGFGSNQKWENVSMFTMNKENENSFSAIVPVEDGKNINIAFKDPAENWDNNSGMNYTFVN